MKKPARYQIKKAGIDACIERAAERNGGTVEKIRGWYANPPEIKE